MKTAVAAVCAALSFCVCADVYDWTGSGGNTVAAACSFSDKDNWRNASVPVSAAGSDIFFTNIVGSLCFVDLPDAFAFRRITGAIGFPVVLLGSSVTSSNGFGSFGSGTAPAVYCYSDLTAGGNVYLNRSVLCGDVVAGEGKTVCTDTGESYHRLDLYANSAGEVRVNPSFTFNLALSWGNFHLVAPRGSGEEVAVWTLADGSPYAFRPETTPEHSLCVGTLVTSAGGELAEGTFLKRVFPDGSIELSNPARLASGTAEVKLTFAAFSPKVTQQLSNLNSSANCAHTYSVSKWREEDELTVKLRYLGIGANIEKPAESKQTVRFSAWTGVPGTIEIANASDQRTGIILDNCHLRFGASLSEEAVPGFPSAAFVKMHSSASFARVSVSDGTAKFANFSSVCGSFVKDGAGMLEVFCPGNGGNAGTIEVREGTLAFLSADGSGVVEVANLSIASGARVELPPNGVLRVTASFSAGEGAVIGGAGTVDIPGGVENVSGLEFEDGASVLFKQSNKGRPIYEQPLGAAPAGIPAFWVSAQDGVVRRGESADVVRWNDVRGEGFMFATNVASVYPTLEADNAGRKFIKIKRVESALKTEIEKTAALVWDVPLLNIRTVFAVIDAYDGGGSWLGSSPRISTHDYWRPAGWKFWNQVMGGQSSVKVTGGRVFVNGEPIPPTGVGLPYAGYDFAATGYRKELVALPMCLAFETTGDTEADAFGFCNYEDGCNGQARIYEYVVYTNVLTAAERLETEEYLMRKWMSAHANYDRLGDVQDRLSSFDVALAPALSVREGDLCAIDVVTGNGSLVKKGNGTLYVEDLASGETSIEVREGLFNLRSVKTSADTLPATPWVHFDASDASSLVFAADGNAGAVTEMRDRRGEGHPKAVMKSGSAVELKSTAAVGGLGMLDFGPYSSESADRKSMRFELDGNGAYNEKLRTTVSVVGTRHGGGVLVGGSSARGGNVSYHDLDGLYRQNPGTYSSPIVSSFNRPSLGMLSSEHPGAARTRLNGDFVVPAKTGFSGGYDLVSLAVYDFFGASGIACCHYGAAVGALEFGEQILFEETLSREQILNVEAYLRRKWFGADEPAYRGSRAKSLVVDKDAVMNIYGDSPLEVSSLSGEGVVNGPLRLADGGELLVEILEDGAVRAPSMSGFNPLAGGKLRISDPGKTIRLGRETTILSGLAAADRVLDNWSAITSRRNGGARFRIEGGKLLMTLLPRGLRIFVR